MVPRDRNCLAQKPINSFQEPIISSVAYTMCKVSLLSRGFHGSEPSEMRHSIRCLRLAYAYGSAFGSDLAIP